MSACLVLLSFAAGAGCARSADPRAMSSSTSTSTTTTWLTTTTSPASTVAGPNGDDFSVTGAWVIRTDRSTGSSDPWVHLNRVPELTAFDTYDASLDVSPDGSLLAVAATGVSAALDESSSRSELYLASTLRPDDLRRLDTGRTSLAMVSFSPDGRWVAVLGDNSLALVPVDGGRPVAARTTVPLPYPHEVTWSPDGRGLSVLNQSNRGEPWTVNFSVDLLTGATSNVP